MKMPVFRYWFDKRAVEIGDKDKAWLEKNGISASKWLVALTWHEERGPDGWQVLVYPVDDGKSFWNNVPYEIPLFSTLDTALVQSKSIISSCTSDSFITYMEGNAWIH